MDVTFLGHSAFKLRGKNATVVCDPFNPAHVGFKFPKTEADIVTISHDHEDHNYSSVVEGGPIIISEPGEYEIKDVSIFGFPSFHDDKNGQERGKNTIFLIEIDGLKICHLGDLGSGLSSDILDEIGVIDILLVPVGEKFTLGLDDLLGIIKKVEPAFVIPMHYQTEGLNEKMFSGLESLDKFLTKMEVSEKVFLDKFSLTKDKSATEDSETKVILLERKN